MIVYDHLWWPFVVLNCHFLSLCIHIFDLSLLRCLLLLSVICLKSHLFLNWPSAGSVSISCIFGSFITFFSNFVFVFVFIGLIAFNAATNYLRFYCFKCRFDFYNFPQFLPVESYRTDKPFNPFSSMSLHSWFPPESTVYFLKKWLIFIYLNRFKFFSL